MSDKLLVYTSSRLYRDLVENGSEQTAKETVDEQLKNRDFTAEQVHKFLTSFKERTYDETNIHKYVDLVSYFMYDIANELGEHIVANYVVKHHQFLDQIYQFSCISYAIRQLCITTNKLTDDDLIYMSKYIEIYELNASNGTDDCYPCDSINYSKITDKGIKDLPLTALHASYNYNITDEGIKNMQLKILIASHNTKITDNGIKHMQLEALFVYAYTGITKDYLRTTYPSAVCKHGVKSMNERIAYKTFIDTT